MDENDIPDASLEIFQWPYDGKSSSIDDQTKYHAVVDGTYIIASVGISTTIAFGIRIVSKSGTYTQAQINQYASTYRITIAAPAGYNFPRIDLCGMGTSGFQAWGQAYMSNPTTVGLLEYGAALVIDSPGSIEAANNVNSGGITPSLVLTWTLQDFENQVVTTPICVKNYFAVLEEVRNYAIYDSSVKSSYSGHAATVQTVLASDMLDSSRYSDDQTRLFDSPTGMDIGNQITGIPGLNVGVPMTDYSPFPKDWPILMEYTNHRIPYSSMGIIDASTTTYGININNMLALKFRTNFQTIKLTYTGSGTGRNYIEYMSFSASKLYNLRTNGYPCTMVGVSDCEFWIIFKMSHALGSSAGYSQACKLTFSQTEASGRTSTIDFNFNFITRRRMILKHCCTWLIPNNSTGISNWEGSINNKHWIVFSLYPSNTNTTNDGPSNENYPYSWFEKVGPPIGKLSTTGSIPSNSQAGLSYENVCGGPWEMYNANRIGGGVAGSCRICAAIQLYAVEENSHNKPFLKICVHTQYPTDNSLSPADSMFAAGSYTNASGFPWSTSVFNHLTNNQVNTIPDATFSLKLGSNVGIGNYPGGSSLTIADPYNARAWVVNTIFSPVQAIS